MQTDNIFGIMLRADRNINVTRTSREQRVSEREEHIANIISYGEAVISTVTPVQIERWAHQIDLTRNQQLVLMILDQAGAAGITVGELRERLKVASLSAVTALIDRLAEHSYVARHPDVNDRRVVRLTLTADGAALMAAMYDTGRDIWYAALAHLSDEELATAAVGMMYMRNAFTRWAGELTTPPPDKQKDAMEVQS